MRFFGVVFCVPSFPGASSCVLLSAFRRAFSGRSILLARYRRQFCLALLCRASFPRLHSQSFFGTLFCRASPMGYSPVHLPRKLPHGRFPWTLSRGRLQCSLGGWIFGSFFSGSFSEQFFAGQTSMGAFAGGFFCALFRRSFCSVLFCRFFFTTAFRKILPHSPLQEFSRGLFAGASLVLSFAWTVSNICSEGRFQCPLSPNIFSAIFSGLSPCAFLLGRFLWAPSRGLFRYTLSCGAFILHFSETEISISSFVGAISER